MISFEKALEIVSDAAYRLPVEQVSLHLATGRILATDVLSDMDIPPFNKSAVDGYACRRSDLYNPLEVIEVVAAGKVPEKIPGSGQCSKIMTGGMLPQGTDMVIMVEDTEAVGEGKIRFTASNSSDNYCSVGEDVRKSGLVLAAGTQLQPQHIAMLATVGCTEPLVSCKPMIGIISTGDELVEPSNKPGISQIRNSNASQLMAQSQLAGAIPLYFGIAPDNENDTFEILNQAVLQSDLVLLSGGISAGDFDFVPEVIQKAGFEILFRSMAVQPGKPLIFAVRDKKYIVALPGNPVSSYVQFEMLVTHLIRKITGNLSPVRETNMPFGVEYVRKKASRKAFIPVLIDEDGMVYPVDYHGSAHMHAYVNAQAIASIPEGCFSISKGTLVNVRFI